MIIESHYIFLGKDTDNEKSFTKEDGTVVTRWSVNGVGKYISETFSASSKHWNNDVFQIMWSANIIVSETNYNVKFLQYDVGGNVYLDIIVEGKTKQQIINCLEFVQEKLLESGIRDTFIAVICYDAISEYYCNRIYPKLNSLERKLRRLLYNIYIFNFGQDYYETTISEELQEKAKKVIKAKGNDKKKKEQRVKEFFYSLELYDIQQMLFNPTWNNSDEEEKQEFLKKCDDLTQLTDDEIRKRFEEFSPKSDWERFFQGKTNETDEEIRILLDKIRIYRNNIAHCKFFTSKDYNDCKKVFLQMNRLIDSAIKITYDKDFYEKNREGLKKSIKKIRETMEKFIKYLEINHERASRNLTNGFRNYLGEDDE